ncbi:arsenate reductase (glutaredoxin) [Pseudoxanthomonas suwonensis]|uniref:arsenate reductase (glutaredoxin) n=1 Tax=Pseudoxanthomonas suwonensis TaxID=314722 RepID=UPI00138EE641|nr:arsenate reductase (glutaredoxin) [Pseudoxanthomonas suwonensis]KAF1700682.1 arsenate reductase (glutaredoxin) [Pseudoxanthomonas suwonensis]
MQRATIWHNPRCSKSRAVLQILRERGIEPVMFNYLAHPPDRQSLRRVAESCGGVRVLVRSSEPVYADLGLDSADDEALLDAMIANPQLINRPVVITRRGARLCRPPEEVVALLD